MTEHPDGLADQLKNAIIGFISTNPGNYGGLYQGPYFDAPLPGATTLSL